MEPMPAQQFREALADLGRVTNPAERVATPGSVS